MQRISRALLIGLFALLQLVAPLVHAHVGNDSHTRALHLPGLEFLAFKDTPIAGQETFPADSGALIVGMSLGITLHADLGHSWSGSDAITVPTSRFSADNRCTRMPLPAPTVPLSRQFIPRALSRAPPVVSR